MDSRRFVVFKLIPSSRKTPRRWRVSVSSKPSSRLARARRIEQAQHLTDPVQRPRRRVVRRVLIGGLERAEDRRDGRV
jgi:hypothetical protein